MGLVLSMKQGDDFFLDDHRVIIQEVISPRQLIVEVEGWGLFDVVDDRMTEIMPDVMMSVGKREDPGLVRVVIDAPREIRILRGDNYRRPQEHEREHTYV